MSLENEPSKKDLERVEILRAAVKALGEMAEECDADDQGDEDRTFLTELKDDLEWTAAITAGEEVEEDEDEEDEEDA
jgi:hypothetical protein